MLPWQTHSYVLYILCYARAGRAAAAAVQEAGTQECQDGQGWVIRPAFSRDLAWVKCDVTGENWWTLRIWPPSRKILTIRNYMNGIVSVQTSCPGKFPLKREVVDRPNEKRPVYLLERRFSVYSYVLSLILRLLLGYRDRDLLPRWWQRETVIALKKRAFKEEYFNSMLGSLRLSRKHALIIHIIKILSWFVPKC